MDDDLSNLEKIEEMCEAIVNSRPVPDTSQVNIDPQTETRSHNTVTSQPLEDTQQSPSTSQRTLKRYCSTQPSTSRIQGNYYLIKQ